MRARRARQAHGRLRQDLVGEPEPHHAALAARLRELSDGAAIVQLEEAWLEQYTRVVPRVRRRQRRARRAARRRSPHNADAEMLRSFAEAADGREALRLRVRAAGCSARRRSGRCAAPISQSR